MQFFFLSKLSSQERTYLEVEHARLWRILNLLAGTDLEQAVQLEEQD